jgi:transposase
MTFIAALRRDGIAAPCLFDGPINGEVFLAWVRQVLVPTLKPGETVIMDNLGSPRGKAVRGAIRAAGAKLCSNTPRTVSGVFRPRRQRFGGGRKPRA